MGIMTIILKDFNENMFKLKILKIMKKLVNYKKRIRDNQMRYCRIKGKFCVFATEYGYCIFTVCREVTE